MNQQPIAKQPLLNAKVLSNSLGIWLLLSGFMAYRAATLQRRGQGLPAINVR